MAGTFDPNAAPFAGGYALCSDAVGFISDTQAKRIDAITVRVDAKAKKFNVLVSSPDYKESKYIMVQAADRDEAKRTAVREAPWKNAVVKDVIPQQYDPLPKRTDGEDLQKHLREEKQETQAALERAIRNRDAELITELREILAEINKKIARGDSAPRNDAQKFERGDIVVDKNGHTGTIVECDEDMALVKFNRGGGEKRVSIRSLKHFN